jgi:hypothetical protein
MKRSRHHTAWAGALATAAELSRRSYDAAITLGNTPTLDLLCASPSGKPFKIQVKSLSYPNAVLIQKSMLDTAPLEDLYFVVALVPVASDQPFRFFVLTHAEVVAVWRTAPKTTPSGQPHKPGWDGLNWGTVKTHEGRWEKLPK